MQDGILYLVFIEPDAPLDGLAVQGLRRLGGGLYLAASTRTRSQLYHAVKRLVRPRRLLVAPLADAPKFSGMEAGALAWLRARGARQGEAGGARSPLLDPDALSAPAKPAARSPARRRR